MRSPLIAIALGLAAVLLARTTSHGRTPGAGDGGRRTPRDRASGARHRRVHQRPPAGRRGALLLSGGQRSPSGCSSTSRWTSGPATRSGWARRDFSLEGPDGLRVPLSTLPALPARLPAVAPPDAAVAHPGASDRRLLPGAVRGPQLPVLRPHRGVAANGDPRELAGIVRPGRPVLRGAFRRVGRGAPTRWPSTATRIYACRSRSIEVQPCARWPSLPLPCQSVSCSPVSCLPASFARRPTRSFDRTQANQVARNVVEYKSDRLHIVAAHHYILGDHDPKWLLIEIGLEVLSGGTVSLTRRDFSIVRPDGVEVPLASQRDYRRARAELLPLQLRAPFARTGSGQKLLSRHASVPTTSSSSSSRAASDRRSSTSIGAATVCGVTCTSPRRPAHGRAAPTR